MRLKTVYGPPPVDMELIEATDVQTESDLREEDPLECGLKAACVPGEREQPARVKCCGT